MKSLTVCENSLIEQKRESNRLNGNESKSLENGKQTDIRATETEKILNEKNDDFDADAEDKENEGSKCGNCVKEKCDSVDVVENSSVNAPKATADNFVGEISETTSGNKGISNVLAETDEVVPDKTDSIDETPEVDLTNESTEKTDAKCEGENLREKLEDIEDMKDKKISLGEKSVKVKADEGPGEAMLQNGERDEKGFEVSTNCKPLSTTVEEDAAESQTAAKEEEKSCKSQKSDEYVDKNRMKKRLSRPMPKSKKMSLLQEEERLRNLNSPSSSDENKSSGKGDLDTGESDDGVKDKKEEKIDGLKPSLKRNVEDNENSREAKRTKELPVNSVGGKKRQMQKNEVSEQQRPKKKKLVSEVEIDIEEKENSQDSSPAPSESENLSTSDSKDSRGEMDVQNENSSGDSALNFPSSSSPEEPEKPKPVAGNTDETTSSILSNLRGTLKSLTRSDLEELIIQKLCEVITERSTVGKLRRKAQALEQDQEKWKAKVQMLNKQVREMEMVMKKYMNEVQKQMKEGTNQVVVPLKVTRSVGLQVSFFSGGNRVQKSYSAQSNGNLNQQPNGSQSKSISQSSAQSQPKLNVPSPNIQTRSKTGSGQKGNQVVSTPHRPSPGQNSQKPGPSKTDYGSVSSQSSANKSVTNQTSRSNKYQDTNKTGPTTPIFQQQQQQQQLNSSKVIDLTDDDDRQCTTIAVRPPGTMRIVSQQPQSQISPNSRFTYILPSGGATAAPPPNGQNLQVLITSPTIPPAAGNRQQIVSMPPLLFKGANPTQPVSHVLNPGTRLLCPKPLKHPAPLPPQPANTFSKNAKLLPPRPALKISKVQTGIVLSWNMTLSPDHAPISSYQLYAYQEGNSPPATSLWKKVGDVKALPLPMACTLTQFMSGHKYHFAVRAVDHHSRIGPFSFPGTIVLVK